MATSSKSSRFFRVGAFALAAAAAALLAGCEDDGLSAIGAHANDPISPKTTAMMKEIGTNENAPVLIRTYKKEAELEIWKMKDRWPLCPAEDLSGLPLVGTAWAQNARGRPPGAGGLFGHAGADETKLRLLPRLQCRLSEHL